MDQKKDYQEEISEEDFNLFYGFIDSVLEETNKERKSNSGADATAESDENILIGEVSEWAPEPFEEFLVGMPSPESGKYYSLQLKPQSPPKAAPPQQKKNSSAAIGLTIGLLTAIGIMFSAHYFTSDDPSLKFEVETHAKLTSIEQGLHAVALNVKSVQSLEDQIKVMAHQLTELSALISTRSTPIQHPRQQAPEEKVTPVKKSGPWVVNLASMHSVTGAAHMLKRIKGLGIDAESIQVTIKGRLWSRIRVANFASKREAQQAIASLTQKTRFSGIWVGKR